MFSRVSLQTTSITLAASNPFALPARPISLANAGTVVVIAPRVRQPERWHPAAWVHSGIHGICLGLALGPMAGVVLGVVHILIDTRIPLVWWIRVFKKSEGSPLADTIAIWTDQVLHIAAIALWLWLVPGK